MVMELPGNIEYFPADQPWNVHGDGLDLVGGECVSCNARCFPRADVCSICGTRGPHRAVSLGTGGRLYSFSTVYIAPVGFLTPYIVAYVDLESGVRVFGQVEPSDTDLAPDDEVATVLGVISCCSYQATTLSYKFRKVQ
jgi:uncharacterized OB-fold protein